ncbi:MAG: fructose PTS transporter subunit IIA, partial [Planctomycetota bacterium]
TEKRSVIEELVGVLEAAGRVSDAPTLLEAVWTREQTKTTGIGHGLAIPHSKSAAVDEPAIAIGRPSTPLEFDSLDGKPVRLVVLLASPVDRTPEHINALAKISKIMSVDEFRARLYESETPETIYELLKSQQS